jgi:hypothetical protein
MTRSSVLDCLTSKFSNKGVAFICMGGHPRQFPLSFFILVNSITILKVDTVPAFPLETSFFRVFSVNHKTLLLL